MFPEEILADEGALWGSPDSGHVVFARFETSLVPSIEFPRYGDKGAIYTETVRIPYPKVRAWKKFGRAKHNY